MSFTLEVLCAQSEAEKQDINSFHGDPDPSNGVSLLVDPHS